MKKAATLLSLAFLAQTFAASPNLPNRVGEIMNGELTCASYRGNVDQYNEILDEYNAVQDEIKNTTDSEYLAKLNTYSTQLDDAIKELNLKIYVIDNYVSGLSTMLIYISPEQAVYDKLTTLMWDNNKFNEAVDTACDADRSKTVEQVMINLATVTNAKASQTTSLPGRKGALKIKEFSCTDVNANVDNASRLATKYNDLLATGKTLTDAADIASVNQELKRIKGEYNVAMAHHTKAITYSAGLSRILAYSNMNKDVATKIMNMEGAVVYNGCKNNPKTTVEQIIIDFATAKK